jgi:hypothetical protein
MAAYAEALGLTVFEYENQPFYDVYPTAPNKGKALQRILREMNVKEGVMYLGDSETDNSAFEESDFAVGVTHGENSPENLQCDFLVEFKDVPKLLRALITNNFQFKPDSPLFKLSRNRSRREMISHARKKGFTNAIGREGFSVPRG